jgi:hypothetical protein
MFSDASPCGQCLFHIALALDPHLAPVPPIVQEAVGGDSEAVERFFEPALWAKEWALPLWLTHGDAAQWQTVAGWWRETRARRDQPEQQADRFMSLAEINAGWDGGDNDGTVG